MAWIYENREEYTQIESPKWIEAQTITELISTTPMFT